MKYRAKCMLAFVLTLGPAISQAASVVNVTYCQSTNTVAQMVYTGPDGNQQSDPDSYWAFLKTVPDSAYAVKIKPDIADGKTATLKGDITVSIEIRNKYSMGYAKTDVLTLVRDDGNSGRWYISPEELNRIKALVTKGADKADTPAKSEGATK